MSTRYKIKLKKGDVVIVRSGKYQGQSGTISRTLPQENKVLVEGLNIVKRHQKPNKAHPQGGIIDITKPLWVSKVALIDPVSKKPTRVGYALDAKGQKIRVAKKSGKEIK